MLLLFTQSTRPIYLLPRDFLQDTLEDSAAAQIHMLNETVRSDLANQILLNYT